MIHHFGEGGLALIFQLRCWALVNPLVMRKTPPCFYYNRWVKDYGSSDGQVIGEKGDMVREWGVGRDQTDWIHHGDAEHAGAAVAVGTGKGVNEEGAGQAVDVELAFSLVDIPLTQLWLLGTGLWGGPLGRSPWTAADALVRL